LTYKLDGHDFTLNLNERQLELLIQTCESMADYDQNADPSEVPPYASKDWDVILNQLKDMKEVFDEQNKN